MTEENEKRTSIVAAPLPVRVAAFILWPILAPLMLVIIAIALVIMWPLLLTSKFKITRNFTY
jgi:cell division septal protein FtsQ